MPRTSGRTSLPVTASQSRTETPSPEAMLTPPADSQLRGQSVRLIEVISTAGSRSEQTQRVEAYWDLCSSVADLSFRKELMIEVNMSLRRALSDSSRRLMSSE